MNTRCAGLLALALAAAPRPATASRCLAPGAGFAAGAQRIDRSTGRASAAANLGAFGRWDLVECLELPLEAELRAELLSLGPDFFGGTDAVGVTTLVVHTGLWGNARLRLWGAADREVGLRAGVGGIARATRVSIEVQGEKRSSTEVRFVGAASLGTYVRFGRLGLALRGAWAVPRADGPALAVEAALNF